MKFFLTKFPRLRPAFVTQDDLHLTSIPFFNKKALPVTESAYFNMLLKLYT